MTKLSRMLSSNIKALRYRTLKCLILAPLLSVDPAGSKDRPEPSLMDQKVLEAELAVPE